MLETARPGEAEAPGRVSMRVKLTACGLLAFALCERDVDLLKVVGVEAERRVRSVDAREPAVAEDGLRPGDARASGLERSVVLRTTLDVLRVSRVHRQALELQRLQARVEARQRTRDRRQQLLAAGQQIAREATTVTTARTCDQP